MISIAPPDPGNETAAALEGETRSDGGELGGLSAPAPYQIAVAFASQPLSFFRSAADARAFLLTGGRP